MIRPLKIGWLMCCFSVVLFLVQPLLMETASAACGPCSDPHNGSWSGIGNGLCGRCGDETYTSSSGSCAGTSGNCTDSTTFATYTLPYTSEPVGSLAYAGCVAALVVGGVAELLLIIIAFPVCTTACVGTIGLACVACLTGAGALAAGADCAFSECIEWCTSGTGYVSGSVPTCS
jgi:hypothetical protein